MKVNETSIIQLSPIEQKMGTGGEKGTKSSLAKKIAVVALFIFAGMALGAGIGIATGGVGVAVIFIGVGSGAAVAIGLLLLAKISAAFIQSINKKTPHEELSAAAARLHDYFNVNPEWLEKKKIFADPVMNNPLPYNYLVKENVKKELMSSNSPLSIELSKSVSKENHDLIHQASRFQFHLLSLRQAKEDQRPYIVADILKELYKEMDFLGDNVKMHKFKEFGKTLTASDMEREDLDSDMEWGLNSLVNELIAPNQKNDFENFMRLLSKVNKGKSKMGIASLSSMATKILCDNTYDQDVTKVVQLLIKHSDTLFKT